MIIAMINKKRLRKLHYTLAPIMLIPLVLTVLTGSLFQVAVLTNNSQQFLWLLELHKGKLGIINLELIYPFVNAFGVLLLSITGIFMWWQIPRRR